MPEDTTPSGDALPPTHILPPDPAHVAALLNHFGEPPTRAWAWLTTRAATDGPRETHVRVWNGTSFAQLWVRGVAPTDCPPYLWQGWGTLWPPDSPVPVGSQIGITYQGNEPVGTVLCCYQRVVVVPEYIYVEYFRWTDTSPARTRTTHIWPYEATTDEVRAAEDARGWLLRWGQLQQQEAARQRLLRAAQDWGGNPDRLKRTDIRDTLILAKPTVDGLFTTARWQIHDLRAAYRLAPVAPQNHADHALSEGFEPLR
jgi:hypothetical protein